MDFSLSLADTHWRDRVRYLVVQELRPRENDYQTLEVHNNPIARLELRKYRE
jgi:hypothetical protein